METDVRDPARPFAPVVWVILDPGEGWEKVINRRGGVDILLGCPPGEVGRLGEMGRLDSMDAPDPSYGRIVHRPLVELRSRTESASSGVPQVDPEELALAKGTLLVEGWAKGYESLVRRAAKARPGVVSSAEGSTPLVRSECLATVRGGPNRNRATRFLKALEGRGLLGPPIGGGPGRAASSDDLLADLLGSALVDAREELRDADAALVRFGHPVKAEAAIGEPPPWPPASVARLRSDPNGASMVETLLGQVAPDPEARAWLVESWARPSRPIDGALLVELAGAAEGRLAREPRFRAWLRGEWTAWTRQLYRRVARVAGGTGPP